MMSTFGPGLFTLGPSRDNPWSYFGVAAPGLDTRWIWGGVQVNDWATDQVVEYTPLDDADIAFLEAYAPATNPGEVAAALASARTGAAYSLARIRQIATERRWAERLGQAWRGIADAERSWGRETGAIRIDALLPRLRRSSEDFVGAPKKGILRSAGNGVWESRAGLRYGEGGAQGNRVKHVLEHAVDNPTRPGAHGVFDAGRKGTLGVIDEAWVRAHDGGPGVSVTQRGARTVFNIDMGRRVGFVGGQVGAAAGNPAATNVRLIVEGENVITAFPF